MAEAEVFPTGVGMNRVFADQRGGGMSVPHRRGDEPSGRRVQSNFLACSPQAWG